VAMSVKPVGRLESNLMFLSRSISGRAGEKEGTHFFEHRVRAGHNFSVH